MGPTRSAILIALLTSAALAGSEIAPGRADFRIYTELPGVYEVTFEDLTGAGLAEAAIPSALLSLDNVGHLVPMRVWDGGDGAFGPGDTFEFVAESASGTTTYYHPWARQNVYWLRFDEARARRLTLTEPQEAGDRLPVQGRRRIHYEEDRLLIRMSGKDAAEEVDPELWYWAKQTHLSKTPFVLPLDGRDADTAGTVNLAVSLRGISSLPRGTSANVREHEVTLSTPGGYKMGDRWDGKKPRDFARGNVPWSRLAGEDGARIELAVTPREADGDPVVDVVMIDWLEVDYGFNGAMGDEQTEVHVTPSDPGSALELTSEASGRVAILGDRSGYVDARWDATGRVTVPLAAGETRLWIRPEGAAHRPVTIERDLPSDLRSYSRQADYLVIAHPSLLEASDELAELHRSRGLAVELINVQDVYDEFGDGLTSPAAIRDFVAHAFHNWRAPRPRWVLLVGDASWDTKNSTVDDANYANWVGRQLVREERFNAKVTEDYDPEKLNDRNLIPTWNYHTSEGHAASDAYFTLLDDDDLPDIALGRLPVASPNEVRAITNKVRQYIEASPFGPWRSRLAWIAGGTQGHQRRSSDLASEFAATGRPATLILPNEAAQLEDKARIVAALDNGTLVTHFIGHGGRFIWRTGPPDLNHQIDLFGLEDLDTLQANAALSVVISVACYSAPFDHPSADSIGEAFLRLPGRGAVAFIGASWRNAPPRLLSELLVRNLSRPGTIGEAILGAKREVGRPDPIHLFNLLGDPATPLAAPGRTIDLAHSFDGDTLELTATLPPEAIGGRVALDYLDGRGVSLASEELPVESPTLSVRRPRPPEVESVSLYFWNEESRIDGLGTVQLPQPEEAPAGSN